MSATTTIVFPDTYRNGSPYPFCPGCGHHAILDHLNRALTLLALDPRKLVLVTDIGCSGLSDQYFATSAFHGLHGRSLTYATGIKLARPDLKVIVIMGDGGAGIGGAHLINAARRNIGLTVLVFNNFNFGMTGGQHSTTTPPGAITATTPAGNLERPLDIAATVAVNGAGYVWRGTGFDPDVPERIVEAVRAECFALLDIWELCTAYYVVGNHASKRTLTMTMNGLGLKHGLVHRAHHPEYAAAYRAAWESERGKPLPGPRPIAPRYSSPIEHPFRVVIAGSAGAKVRSTARLIADAALLSGLHATQRDDYPITVKTGHSVSELVLSPAPIDYTGIARPDALIALSAEGLAKVGDRLGAMTPTDTVFAVPELLPLETSARIVVIDPDAAPMRLLSSRMALYVVARAIATLGVVPPDAVEAAAAMRPKEQAASAAEVLKAAAACPASPTGGAERT